MNKNPTNIVRELRNVSRTSIKTPVYELHGTVLVLIGHNITDSESKSNLGGATLDFDIDYSGDELIFGYAICAPDENFNKKEGRAIAAKRKIEHPSCIPYHRDLSLVENVRQHFLYDAKDELLNSTQKTLKKLFESSEYVE